MLKLFLVLDLVILDRDFHTCKSLFLLFLIRSGRLRCQELTKYCLNELLESRNILLPVDLIKPGFKFLHQFLDARYQVLHSVNNCSHSVVLDLSSLFVLQYMIL